jgi:uncharacterized membrane protein YsdA (DUF1294 family)
MLGFALADTPSSPSDRGVRLSGASLIAAAIVLTGFGIFVVFLLGKSGADEVKWARLAWVFSSVEAVAFGAAGALFGSTIQRSRAEKAEEQARQSSHEAANGRALAAVLKSEEVTGPGEGLGDDVESFGIGTDPVSGGAQIARRHAAIARELFP